MNDEACPSPRQDFPSLTVPYNFKDRVGQITRHVSTRCRSG